MSKMVITLSAADMAKTIKVFLALHTIVLITAAVVAEGAKAAAIEQDCIDYRRDISCGRMQIRADLEILGNPGDQPQVTHADFVIAFKGDKFFCKYTEEIPHSRDASVEQSRVRYVRDNSSVILCADAGEDGGIRGLTSVQELAVMNRPMAPSLRVFDPRIYGLTPSSVLQNNLYSYNTSLTRPDRVATVEAEVTVGAVRGKEVSVDIQGGGSLVLRFAEGEPSRLEYASLTSQFKGSQLVDAINVKYKRWGPTAIWFPKSLIYERIIDGRVCKRSTESVIECSLNEEERVDDTLFGLASFGLRDGDLVDFSGVGGTTQVWQNGGLSQIGLDSTQDHKLRVPQSWHRRSIIVVNLIVTIGLAVLVLLRGRLRSRNIST